MCRNQWGDLVVQPGDHQELFDWVEMFERTGAVESGHWQQQGQTYRYRIAREVPLTGQRQRWLNFFEVWVTNQTGRLGDHNSWVTRARASRES